MLGFFVCFLFLFVCCCCVFCLFVCLFCLFGVGFFAVVSVFVVALYFFGSGRSKNCVVTAVSGRKLSQQN